MKVGMVRLVMVHGVRDGGMVRVVGDGGRVKVSDGGMVSVGDGGMVRV